MLRYLFLLLSLIPQAVFAQDSGGFLFTPPPTDSSVGYLSMIFGVVDGVLHSATASQIMGAMFGVFNSALLVLAGIIFTYILLTATLKTAHEGEMLGQQWSSIWIPIRAVLGIGLLVPKASGYSFIQIFIMWIVVQGVGVADTVWDAALNYVQRGGILNTAVRPPDFENKTATLINPLVGDIFKSQVCMFGIHNSLTKTAPPNWRYPGFASTLLATGVSTGQSPPVYCQPGICQAHNNGNTCDCKAIINFPGKFQVLVDGKPTGPTYAAGMCGHVTWNLGTDQGGGMSGGGGQIANPSGTGASDSRSIAVQQIVSDTQALAQATADVIVSPTKGSGPPSANALTDLLSNNQTLANAALDYTAIIEPYLKRNTPTPAFDYDYAKGIGWIWAGGFYFQLATLARGAINLDANPPEAHYTANFSGCNPAEGVYVPPCVKDAISLKEALVPGKPVCAGSTSVSGTAIDNAICWNTLNIPGESARTQNWSFPGVVAVENAPGVVAGLYNTTTWGLGSNLPKVTLNMGSSLGGSMLGAIGTPSSGIANIFGNVSQRVLGIFISPFGALGGPIYYLNQLTQGTTDPILTISQLGVSLVNWVETIWLGGAIGIFILQMVGGLFSSVSPIPGAILSTLLWFVPTLTAIFLSMLVTGAMMAYYVPLIPFILFLFAVIGWFVGVIESMIAAPLVALGVAHPEGHDVFGKAEPAVMIITNIFLRPSLIVIGFIAGAILSTIGLMILNVGMGFVIGYEPVDWLGIVAFFSTIIIYVGIVLAIINKSFALIYEIPNKVMRWLGGLTEQFGEAEGAGEVQRGFEAGAGAIKGGMESFGQRAQEGAEKGGEKAAEASAKLKSRFGKGRGGVEGS